MNTVPNGLAFTVTNPYSSAAAGGGVSTLRSASRRGGVCVWRRGGVRVWTGVEVCGGGVVLAESVFPVGGGAVGVATCGAFF